MKRLLAIILSALILVLGACGEKRRPYDGSLFMFDVSPEEVESEKMLTVLNNHKDEMVALAEKLIEHEMTSGGFFADIISDARKFPFLSCEDVDGMIVSIYTSRSEAASEVRAVLFSGNYYSDTDGGTERIDLIYCPEANAEFDLKWTYGNGEVERIDEHWFLFVGLYV